MKKSRKRIDWVKTICLTLVGVIVLGCSGLGVWKIVDLVKDAQTKAAAAEEEHGTHSGQVPVEAQLAEQIAA